MLTQITEEEWKEAEPVNKDQETDSNSQDHLK